MKDKHFLSPSKVLKKFEECFLLGEEIKIVVDGKGIQCSKIAGHVNKLDLRPWKVYVDGLWNHLVSGEKFFIVVMNHAVLLLELKSLN